MNLIQDNENGFAPIWFDMKAQTIDNALVYFLHENGESTVRVTVEVIVNKTGRIVKRNVFEQDLRSTFRAL